jgi:hypothetical protein
VSARSCPRTYARCPTRQQAGNLIHIAPTKPTGSGTRAAPARSRIVKSFDRAVFLPRRLGTARPWHHLNELLVGVRELLHADTAPDGCRAPRTPPWPAPTASTGPPHTRCSAPSCRTGGADTGLAGGAGLK